MPAHLGEIAYQSAAAVRLQCEIMAGSASEAHPKEGVSVVLSGAIAGLCFAAWSMRDRTMTTAEFIETMVAGVTHNILEAERHETMGGPVAGHG